MSRLNYLQIKSIISDIFLITRWDNDPYLVRTAEINKLINHFGKFPSVDMPHIADYGYLPNCILNDTITVKNLPIIDDFLLLGSGKLSLCGEGLLKILTNPRGHVKYDLICNCGSDAEAKDILTICNDLLLDKYPGENFTCSDALNIYLWREVRFIININISKARMLLNYDISAARIGYNPIDGIFATICGAFAYAMKTFALDLSTYNRSQLDFFSDLGLKILLPGLPKFILKSKLITPDGILEQMAANLFIFKQDDLKQFKPLNYNFNRKSIKLNPRNWYGDCYQPFVIGITNEKLQALLDCRKNIPVFNQIPFEIIKVICYYWIGAEVQEAKLRLLTFRAL